MCCTLSLVVDNDPTTSIPISCGFVERMGDGHFIILQDDDQGITQAVTLTERDLRAMLAFV